MIIESVWLLKWTLLAGKGNNPKGELPGGVLDFTLSRQGSWVLVRASPWGGELFHEHLP